MNCQFIDLPPQVKIKEGVLGMNQVPKELIKLHEHMKYRKEVGKV